MADRFEEKFQAALDEMDAVGIWRSNSNPPYLRILRSFGLKVRPPHYAALSKVGLGLGVWFAAIWGLIMWSFVWAEDGMAPMAAFTSSVFAGVFFGVAMAIYYATSRRKHNLSQWDDL